MSVGLDNTNANMGVGRNSKYRVLNHDGVLVF